MPWKPPLESGLITVTIDTLPEAYSLLQGQEQINHKVSDIEGEGGVRFRQISTNVRPCTMSKKFELIYESGVTLEGPC